MKPPLPLVGSPEAEVMGQAASPSALSPRNLPALLPVFRLLGFVWFYAANVVGCTFHQGAHEVVGLFLVGRIRTVREKDQLPKTTCRTSMAPVATN